MRDPKFLISKKHKKKEKNWWGGEYARAISLVCLCPKNSKGRIMNQQRQKNNWHFSLADDDERIKKLLGYQGLNLKNWVYKFSNQKKKN